MPKKSSSAAKQARASERKRAQNHAVKSRIRTGLRHFLGLAKADPKAAREHARQVVSLLDKAAKADILHVNTARRHKARVMARLASLASA